MAGLKAEALGQHQGGAEVLRQYLHDEIGLDGLDRPRRLDTGAMGDAVERTNLRTQSFQPRHDGIKVGKVENTALVTLAFQFGQYAVKPFPMAARGNDPCTELRQIDGGGAADARRGAGNEDGAAGQVHGIEGHWTASM